MKLRFFIILLLGLSCPSWAGIKTVNFGPTQVIKNTISLSPFSRIAVRGLMDVHLHTGFSKPKVILKGHPADLDRVKINQVDSVLSITMQGAPKFGPVEADIHGDTLSSFNYQGLGHIHGKRINTQNLDLMIANDGRTDLNGQIGLSKLTLIGKGITTIEGIKSYRLSINLEGNPKLNLRGMANISDVKVNGQGYLNMYWVKSPKLVIRATGDSNINLAGITEFLDVELWNHAKFNGRYLRAKIAFVKTHNRSLAEISALSKQHTLALDGSDIYFYNLAKFSTDFMGNDGAVLDMMRDA